MGGEDRMKGISASVIGLAIVAMIILAGEAYAYLPADRGFSSGVEIEGNTATYSIGAAGAYVGSAVLVDNGDLLPVNEVYIYRDPSYLSDVDEGNITATGSQVWTQSYYIDQLTKNLKIRGITNVKILNANELKDRLQSDMPTVSQKGLIVISGTVPDTILGSSTILEDWIDAGGFLYWVGNIIGHESSTPDEIIAVNKEIALIGTDSFYSSKKSATMDTELRSKFSYENQHLEFAPDVTTISGRTVLGTGFSDDGTHYSVTFIEKGNGQICICSGELSSQQTHDLSISIGSGLTYKSQIVDFKESEFNRSMSDSFDMPTVHGNLSIYISVGKYHCAYAQRFGL